MKISRVLLTVLCMSVMMLACSSENGIESDHGTTPPDGNLPSSEELTVLLAFKDGWPFNEPCVEASAQTKEGESYTYTYKYGDSDSETMTLDFTISHGTVSTSIDYTYSDGALRFNSTGGNNGEIKLPGIEGYYLSRVDARHISAESSRFALKDYFIAKPESLNERFLAGWATTGALTMFWMPVTEGLAQKQQPGQSFTLEMRDKHMAVSEIKLVYTKSKPEGEPPLDVSGLHLYAHRGKWIKDGSDYFIPENSLTGIQMAALMGYEGVEMDVRYTKDNVMVVMHDATINKSMRNADYTEISGDVKIADLTFDELRTGYVLESTEPAFRLKCPTLEEMLLECKRCSVKPMLHSSIYESYELAQQIMGDDWVCFTGTDFENVKRVRSELNSKCTILWSISSGFDTVEKELVKIGGDCGISSMESGYYTPEMIKRLRDGGYHVQCSIFPSGEERLAIENGVDYVLTDCVLPEGASTDITADVILGDYPPQSSVTDELPEEFNIVLDFSKGWPFNEQIVEKADQGTYVRKNAGYFGESYTYTYDRYPDPDDGREMKTNFKFNISKGLCDTTAYRYFDKEYLSLGYNGDSYSGTIRLPAVDGRYLTQVRVVKLDYSNDRITIVDPVTDNRTTAKFSGNKGKDDNIWIFNLYADKCETIVTRVDVSYDTNVKAELAKEYEILGRSSQATTNVKIVSIELTYSKTNPGNCPTE